MLPTLVESILRIALDAVHSKVQVAALSAFIAIVEQSSHLIEHFLETIYQNLSNALLTMRNRSLHLLYEVFSTLADCFGEAIAANKGMFMPTLMGKFKICNELMLPLLRSGGAISGGGVRECLPLMECIALNASTLGMDYQAWALETLDLALELIEAGLLHCSLASSGSEEEVSERTNERTSERTNERMSERTNERTNERTYEWLQPPPTSTAKQNYPTVF